jgi:hypothetical protein
MKRELTVVLEHLDFDDGINGNQGACRVGSPTRIKLSEVMRYFFDKF